MDIDRTLFVLVCSVCGSRVDRLESSEVAVVRIPIQAEHESAHPVAPLSRKTVGALIRVQRAAFYWFRVLRQHDHAHGGRDYIDMTVGVAFGLSTLASAGDRFPHARQATECACADSCSHRYRTFAETSLRAATSTRSCHNVDNSAGTRPGPPQGEQQGSTRAAPALVIVCGAPPLAAHATQSLLQLQGTSSGVCKTL